MPCQPVTFSDGTVVLVNVKPGQTITDEDIAVLQEFYAYLKAAKEKEDDK